MSSVPKTMKALVSVGGGKAEVKDHPVPQLEDNDVLVKIEYVALNPTDWKHTAFISQPSQIIGCDYSGTIVSLGSNLSNPSWKVGDRVAGMVHGGKFETKGAFAEYARVESDLLFKVPEVEKGEKACGWGIPFTTAAQILYTRLGFPFIGEPKVSGSPWFLVYGGSTSVGLFAVQLARLAGYKVIATSGPHNFDLVTQYGADEVVDYHNPEQAIQQIRQLTSSSITKVLDCIAEGDSLKICLESFASEGERKLNTLLPPNEEISALAKEKGVEVENTLAYSLMGKAFTFVPGKDIPFIASDREFYVKLCKETPEFITKYNVKVNPVKRMEGGLGGIHEGFELLKAGKVSGQKLVYKL